MHRVLTGVAVVGVIAAIPAGARQDMLSRPDAADARFAPDAAVPVRAVVDIAEAARVQAPTPAPLPAAAGSASGAGASPPRRALSAAGAQAWSTPSPVAFGQAPDAEALLRRAAAAYRRVRSLRAAFVQVVHNPLLGGSITSRGTLYERRPDRFLMRFTQPAGDVLVSDGRYLWVYYPSVDPKQVIRTHAGAAGQAVDLQAQFVNDPEKRFTPRLVGREAVAGRKAYVLRLVPRAAEPFKQLTVWLDPRDYLARRLEITEENGSVRRLDLSDVRVNLPLPDSLFRFKPPAGAHVVERP